MENFNFYIYKIILYVLIKVFSTLILVDTILKEPIFYILIMFFKIVSMVFKTFDRRILFIRKVSCLSKVVEYAPRVRAKKMTFSGCPSNVIFDVLILISLFYLRPLLLTLAVRTRRSSYNYCIISSYF